MGIKRLRGALLPILVFASLLAPLFLTASPTPVEARRLYLAAGGYARSIATLIVTDNECIVATLGPNAYNINCENDHVAHTPSPEPEIYYQPGDLPPVMAAAEVGLGRVVVFGSANTFGGEVGGGTARAYGCDKLLINAYKWLDQKHTKKILWYESHGVYFKLVNYEDHRGDCITWAENVLEKEEGFTVDGTGYNKDDPYVYPITAEMLEPYSILQLNNPEYDPRIGLSDEQISAINDWVRAGGGLFLVPQSDYFEYFKPNAHFAAIANRILAPLDVPFRFQDDEAKDNEEFIEAPHYPRMYYTDHEIIPDDVMLTISPEYQETWPGGSFAYDVAVQNIGPHQDSYTLEMGHTATDWDIEFGPYVMVNVDPGEKRPVTLRIKIPSDANIGAEDDIFVKVTSQSDPTITKTARCTLRAAKQIRPPIDDAYTHEGRPNTKFGAARDMYVGWYQHAQGAGSERTWLKFDLSSLPADATIGRVRLWLYCYRLTGWGSHDTRCYSLENDGWTEETITWNNQPPAIGRQLGDAQTIEEEGKWYSWEVGSFVQSERAKDNLVSFCLIDRDENVDTNHSPWFVAKENWSAELLPYLEFLPSYDVDVSISPAQRYKDSPPGGTLTYTVTVKNTGSMADTYSLTKADDAGWPLDLSPSMLSLGVLESGTATLTVTIPTDTPICTKDDITVTATGTGVSDSASCVAHAFTGRKLQPIADAYVDDGFPGTNHGNDNTLYVQSHDAAPGEHGNENIYLKFDLSGIPSSSTIVGAEIWLWCEEAADADINAQCREVENDAWVEGEINWGKAYYLPGGTISTTLLEKDVVGWYFWDVTPFVLEQREVDNIVSFCIGAAVPDASGRYIFCSREWPLENGRPRLKVTGENIPPENIENIPGVDVSISPGSQSGSPGGTLDYTVTVTNTGSGSDTYSLSATDTAGWTLNIPSTVGPLSPGASNTVTLRVAVPGDAENGATDSVTVTATSQADISVRESASCTAVVSSTSPTEGFPIVYVVAAVVVIVVIIAAVLIVKPF